MLTGAAVRNSACSILISRSVWEKDGDGERERRDKGEAAATTAQVKTFREEFTQSCSRKWPEQRLDECSLGANAKDPVRSHKALP